MPFSISIIDSPAKTVFARFYGLFTADVLRDWTRICGARSCARDPVQFYLDFNGLSRFDVGFSSLSGVVYDQSQTLRHLPPGTPCLILATGDMNFGIARMYQQIAEGLLPLHIHVERLSAEGLRWLNLPYDAPDRAVAWTPEGARCVS